MIYSVGYTFETLRCGIATVVEKLPNRRYLVRFDDGYEKITTDRSIFDRKIKNPFAKTVFGVGFLGEGYKCWVNGKLSPEYSTWICMMTRCYNNGTAGNSYLDKYVCNDWHNFQNFAEWCQKQPGFNLTGWQLDKDLLAFGNKEYNTQTCCFLPAEINASLSHYSSSVQGFRFNSLNKRWYVSYFNTINHKSSTISFKTEKEAEDFYRANRYNKIKTLIPVYKEKLSGQALDRLLTICE